MCLTDQHKQTNASFVRYSAVCWRAERVPAAGGWAGRKNLLASGSGWFCTSPGRRRNNQRSRSWLNREPSSFCCCDASTSIQTRARVSPNSLLKRPVRRLTWWIRSHSAEDKWEGGDGLEPDVLLQVHLLTGPFQPPGRCRLPV